MDSSRVIGWHPINRRHFGNLGFFFWWYWCAYAVCREGWIKEPPWWPTSNLACGSLFAVSSSCNCGHSHKHYHISLMHHWDLYPLYMWACINLIMLLAILLFFLVTCRSVTYGTGAQLDTWIILVKSKRIGWCNGVSLQVQKNST